MRSVFAAAGAYSGFLFILEKLRGYFTTQLYKTAVLPSKGSDTAPNGAFM